MQDVWYNAPPATVAGGALLKMQQLECPADEAVSDTAEQRMHSQAYPHKLACPPRWMLDRPPK